MKKTKLKTISLAISLLMIIGLVAGGTLAFLRDDTQEITNTFEPSAVTTEVEESFAGGTKSDVKIRNTGNTDAWIRATYVVTWQDAQGNVLGTAPTTEDYTLTPGTATEDGEWLTGEDGFFYWNKPVAAKGSTGQLIASVTKLKDAPKEGYDLCVEILCGGIQAEPDDAFEKSWGSSKLTIVNDTLVEGGTN